MKRLIRVPLLLLLSIAVLTGCGGGGNDGGGGSNSLPVINEIKSSALSKTGDKYAVGSMVRIDIAEGSGEGDIVSGTIRITSASTGYDSGTQKLSFGSIFFNWDTTGLKSASDYIVDVVLTDSAEQTTTLTQGLSLTLTLNPPAINKLVSSVDMGFPSRGISTVIVRIYLLDSGFDGPLGFGWTHTYLMHIVETSDGLVKVFNPDGSGSFFKPKGDGTYDPPIGDFRTLTKNSDGIFQLKEKFGTLFNFDATGRLTSIEDRNGNGSTLNYDGNGRLTTVIDSSGQATTFTYNATNRVASITDPAGQTIAYGYDSTGNLISFTDIGGFTTTYAYDTNRNLTTITDPSGRHTFFTADSNDRLETVSNDGSVNKLTFAYSNTAPQMTVTDILGNQTVFTYNDDSQITSARDPSGNTTNMTYDAGLNLTSTTDANGGKSAFTYDTKGNILTITDAQGNTTAFTYNTAFNQPSSIRDAKGKTTTFSYDANGNLITMTYPDGSLERFSYDTFGNLVGKTDRMGRAISFTHDSRGLLTKKSFPDGSSDTFTYDTVGNLTRATDENGAIAFAYDSLNRVTQVTYPGGEVVSYGYDAASNRTRLTYPDGTVLNYAYDAVNRLAQISTSGQTVASYTYDLLSRVTRQDLQNGTFSTFTYDLSSRLLDLINKKSTSDTISSFSYTYDNVGNRVTMTTLEGTTQYFYDAINQLTKVVLPGGAATTYNLDPSGNRASVANNGSTTNYTTNDLNQYTTVGTDSYTYDGNGNLTGKTTASGTTTYTYDFENSLVRVNTPTEVINYTYDPFGRRTSKTTSAGTTKYIYDGLQVIMEKNSIGTVQASYIYGIGIDEVLVMKRNGQNYYYSQDGLGSVSDLTNPLGNLVESYSYDAFGTPSNISSVGNPYLFTGREYDPETGLYYYRARYYNPVIGRFINADPIGFLGGTNFYAYVGNNPINLTDPTGENPFLIGFLGGVLIKQLLFGTCSGFNDCAKNGLPSGYTFEILSRWQKAAYNHDVRMRNREIRTGKNFLQPHKSISAFKIHLKLITEGLFPWVPIVKESLISVKAGEPTFIQPSQRDRARRIPEKSGVRSKGLFAKISVPYEDSLVRADVPIFGLAYGDNFKEYHVEYGEGENPSEWKTIVISPDQKTKDVTPEDLDDSGDIKIQGNLATLDTGLKNNYVYLPSHPKDHPIDLKGVYTVRLVVVGKDGSIAEDRVTVEVGDVIPNAWGGRAISKDGKVVLIVPEQALRDSFRVISIKPVQETPAPLPPGRQLIRNIYAFREAGERFTKEAILEMEFQGEDLRGDNPDRLGIYAYNAQKKAWEHLKSMRYEGKDKVFAKVKELRPYYALMVGNTTAEGSTLEKESDQNNIQKVSTIISNGHYLVRDTFEDGMGEWSNRDGDVGAEVALDNTATFDGTRCLKIANINGGGNFAVNLRKTSFNAREYPVVQFDYRIAPGVKTNFLVKVSGRWYEIGFTDDNKVLHGKRVNIAHIGAIEGVITDDQWHTARFDLYSMLRTKTGNTIVEEMIMADWDVGGYMKLQFGHNKKGAAYYIDNFSIGREVSAGLRMDEDTILVDDFNQKKETNALGGGSEIFTSSIGGTLKAIFKAEDGMKKGHALELSYDVLQAGSYAGYITSLQNLDLRGFQTLTFLITGMQEGQDLLVGLKDYSGHENKVLVSNYLSKKIATTWHKVEIPIIAFSNIVDWSRMENLSLSFENKLNERGSVFIDDIEFHKEMKSFTVDNFERPDRKNISGRDHRTFVIGSAAINGSHAKGSSNGIYRLSYGGNIGEIKAYASDLFTYAGWTTDLGGIDCSQCGTLSFRIRGAEGKERPNIYLDDGNFRWGVDVTKYAKVTPDWQSVTIPLNEFADYGVDLTHLAEFQIIFEWERMSGTIYLDDIHFGQSEK